jgi:cytochrome bd-type quinol oxidase subunit 1
VPSHTMLDFSRWQYAFAASFHMTFPAITVGLAVFLSAVYAAYARTYDQSGGWAQPGMPSVAAWPPSCAI